MARALGGMWAERLAIWSNRGRCAGTLRVGAARWGDAAARVQQGEGNDGRCADDGGRMTWRTIHTGARFTQLGLGWGSGGRWGSGYIRRRRDRRVAVPAGERGEAPGEVGERAARQAISETATPKTRRSKASARTVSRGAGRGALRPRGAPAALHDRERGSRGLASAEPEALRRHAPREGPRSAAAPKSAHIAAASSAKGTPARRGWRAGSVAGGIQPRGKAAARLRVTRQPSTCAAASSHLLSPASCAAVADHGLGEGSSRASYTSSETPAAQSRSRCGRRCRRRPAPWRRRGGRTGSRCRRCLRVRGVGRCRRGWSSRSSWSSSRASWPPRAAPS